MRELTNLSFWQSFMRSLQPPDRRLTPDITAEMVRIGQSGLFDPDWYSNVYPDVRTAGLDPLRHFAEHGGPEGRSPGPRFDSRAYLRKHPHLTALGVNPLIHFLDSGASAKGPNAFDPELLSDPSDDATVQDARRGILWDASKFQQMFTAANTMNEFGYAIGVRYKDTSCLDLGSGSGIVALGTAMQLGANVTGVDLFPTSYEALIEAALHHGISDAMAAKVTFQASDAELSALPDGSFDHVYSTDVFEHVFEPVSLLRSVHRVLKPGGLFYLKIWPLWKSEWGAHLFEDFERFSHLVQSREEILRGTKHPLHRISYDSCSRIELEDLQRALLTAGLTPVKIEMRALPIHIPDFAVHLSWTDIGIDGVTVLARRN
jgi:SAM-dependent methyltransferase